MNSGNSILKPFDLTKIGPFSEEEMTAMANALFKKIDIPSTPSGPAPNMPLINYFGLQNSGKTTTTTGVERFCRRNKFKTYCPPESAEHKDIRDDSVEDPISFQVKHLNVVIDQYLHSKNRNHHITQVSRNLPDMLYWYIKGERKGLMSAKHVASAKEWIYQILGLDYIDVSLFFTCSVESAMDREYGHSVTQKRGSKMNEQDTSEAREIYEVVLRELRDNVPQMPVFKIDTSGMSIKQQTEEALRYILPTLCIRYQVPDYTFMPYALSLMEKIANHSAYFEEQLKLYGHPQMDNILKSGWIFEKESTQRDVYLNPKINTLINPQGQVFRLRQEGGIYKYMYKGEERDTLLSHRLPYILTVEKSEAENILNTHKTIATLNKKRLHFRKYSTAKDGHFFTLHIDSVNELGNFTEIRTRGSQDKKHTKELLSLAEELGFTTSSIVNGNYLSLALNT